LSRSHAETRFNAFRPLSIDAVVVPFPYRIRRSATLL
jgi:hypothetical protein